MPAKALSTINMREEEPVKRYPPFVDAMTHGFLLPLVCDLRDYRRPGQRPNQARHHKHERASAINNPPPALSKAKR